MRGKLRLWGVVLIIVFISSCKKEASQHIYDIPEGNIVLTASKIHRVSQYLVLEITDIEDTRCPIGVVCCSPGEVHIFISVIEQDGIRDYSLEYSKMRGQSTDTISNHKIEIIEVTPLRYENDTLISLNDYRVVVDVEYLLD